jgi:hypothetical protein
MPDDEGDTRDNEILKVLHRRNPNLAVTVELELGDLFLFPHSENEQNFFIDLSGCSSTFR